MTETKASHPLRVLIVNEHAARLEQLAKIVLALGYDVIARAVDVSDVGRLTRAERPDVALVGLGESSERALMLISTIVREATCPVIAVLAVQDPAFIAAAAKRGIFAYVTHDEPEELQGAIEIVLNRYGEFRNLEGAFGRRALIERAKGILMERHGVDERAAFELLRRQSQRSGRKLTDVADAVVGSHRLLPAASPSAVPSPEEAVGT
jgi:response regulator NasT